MKKQYYKRALQMSADGLRDSIPSLMASIKTGKHKPWRQEECLQCYKEVSGLLSIGVPHQFLMRSFQKWKALIISAKRRNLDFSLTLSDVALLMSHTHCYYTGAELSDSDNAPRGQRRTIDRKSNNLGYIASNVVACSEAANLFKNRVFEQNGAPEIDIDSAISLMSKMRDDR